MKKIILSANRMKVLKIVHLFFSFMWIGGAFSLILLLFTVSPEGITEMYLRARTLQLIDDWLIIPGAMGCLLTGVIYGVFTKWGFFKHRWIIVKWICTVAMVLLGTFAMGKWVDDNVLPFSQINEYVRNYDIYFYYVKQTQIWGGMQTLTLLFVMVISVIKPFKRQKQKV